MIVLVVGIFAGTKFQSKLNQKAESKIKEVASIPVNKPNSPPRYKMINFLIREQNSGDIKEKETRIAVENLFNSNKVRFIFKTFGKAPANSPNEAAVNHMGLIDASRVVEQMSMGFDLIPLFTASPNSQAECFSEMQVVTKRNVQALENLSGKRMGLEKISVNIAKLLLKQLKDNNVTLKSIHIYSSKDNAIKDLTTDKIDVMFDRASVFSNGLMTSRIGIIQNGAFSQYPEFKILTTSSFKIPCKVIFMNSLVPPAIKEELEKKFEDLYTQPESRELMARAILIGSIKKVTSESWQPIESQLKGLSDIELDKYASEVTYDKF